MHTDDMVLYKVYLIVALYQPPSTHCMVTYYYVSFRAYSQAIQTFSGYLPHKYNIHVLVHTYIHVIVVLWSLQCMGYVLRKGCTYFRGWSPRKYIQYEGGTIPCTVKTMRQLSCTGRSYKANHRISYGARIRRVRHLYIRLYAVAILV